MTITATAQNLLTLGFNKIGEFDVSDISTEFFFKRKGMIIVLSNSSLATTHLNQIHIIAKIVDFNKKFNEVYQLGVLHSYCSAHKVHYLGGRIDTSVVEKYNTGKAIYEPYFVRMNQIIEKLDDLIEKDYDFLDPNHILHHWKSVTANEVLKRLF